MKKNIYPNLKNVRIGIVSHVFASGPSQALLEYLIEENRAAEVFFIGHPLFFEQKKERSSFFILYKKGKKINEKFLKNIKLPGIITYFKDFFLTIVWVLQTSGKWDLLVCADNLNSLSGLILRFFKKVKKVIFYTVDYVPQRFENKLLNNFYHLIDKICVYYVDEVWNLSPEMEKARKKFRGIVTGKNKQRVIPMGIWFDKIKKIPFEKIKKHTLVFVGHLIEKQGIQTVIQAIPGVVSKIPDFRFLIVGTGPYEKTLKKITKDLGLEKRVEFTGYIESHHEMENIINKCVCAIAFYKGGDRLRNFTYYSDPG
ncbi:glycosyltransferase, partial [Candidatus Shapirobacteria bacterium]|nr:glycosyltransferase [Candidatus Shapirobacteria bacterium]